MVRVFFAARRIKGLRYDANLHTRDRRVVHAASTRLQSHFRTYTISLSLLVERYEARLAAYTNERLSAMTATIAPHVIARRAELEKSRLQLEAEVAELGDPLKHLDEARAELWACEG